MVLQQKLLEKADFIVTITGPVMVGLVSSDKWKAPSVNSKLETCITQLSINSLSRPFLRAG